MVPHIYDSAHETSGGPAPQAPESGGKAGVRESLRGLPLAAQLRLLSPDAHGGPHAPGGGGLFGPLHAAFGSAMDATRRLGSRLVRTIAPPRVPSGFQELDRTKAPAGPGWALAEQGGARADRTEEYRAAADAVRAGESALPADADRYVYLLVPGLFTQHYPGYMKENLAHLESLGLDARLAPIDTVADVATNAGALRAIIADIAAEEGRQVVAIGHSKGGVDVTAALARFPELRPHVRAVIAMQAPYGGTPVATDIARKPPVIDLVSGAIRRLFRGDPSALTDLTYEVRQEFVRADPYDASAVATVSYATTGGPAVSATAPSAKYMRQRHGLESDGLVPREDAIIPGSELVTADDQDHASPVLGVLGRGEADVPAAITEGLIAVALRRAQELEE